MASEEFYIGMDVGGTTFKALAVSLNGRVLGRVQHQTQADAEPETVVKDMLGAIERLQAEIPTERSRLKAVGFGVPGIIDLPAGIVRQSPNLPQWMDFDLRAALESELSVPLTIENDANAAAIGESWLGAGRGVSHLIVLTLGTGVGGGVIIDGQILHGALGYAGELGHMVVDPNGPPCGCGSHGCLEQFASGTAIARMAEPSFGNISAERLAEIARHGDERAMAVFRDIGRYLGIACASFANLLNPQRIILGGAVALAFDLFGGSMRATMRQRTMTRTYDCLEIVPAECGPDAGGLGAAYQAIQHVAD